MGQSDYRLDDQVGFLMRRANQRHLALFAARIDAVTPMQFAVLARLYERGAMSQNALGRAVAMDGATIKGVVDRLRAKALIAAGPDPDDQRRLSLRLSPEGRDWFAAQVGTGHQISAETLAPLSEQESATLLALLARLG
ncbi:MarR family transcriptional regulator [Pseudooceanicola sp.]|uniref:MarR family winged helix-turn-helix transcriptional regulator n=1 Tax=Pseudooceanicola sp. TaxID=1914328 RepID=UPI0026151217|nr:MarR family transcriptional regulator [Pseudooceanicola sp.]MDF1855637.1 MarR family transcriptional regulator [Pseudooceanicola sp.]